jgi:hypothetical protein
VVLVDDGSSDGTPARLDELAAADPRFRVIRTPNSGWPGRPRNLGIDAARGDYVFLSDHDDRLHPEALQRLTDFALEHGSDVVVGRIVGVGRSAPKRIFARTLVDAQEDPALLMTSLTPQKLYRRAFLEERGIRFPEGRRRLEDHLFVTKAYLRARRVSVYADAPIYYFVLRADGGNASRGALDWPSYFANAAESVAVVDAEAPDEATRLVMRERWLRVEAVARLRGRRLLDRADRTELLVAARDFLRSHYSAEEVDRLPTADRLIGRLLLDAREADVLAFAAWEAGIRLELAVTAAALDASTGYRAEVRAEALPSAPLPAALQDLPPGYPTRAAIERIGRLPDRASMTGRLRRADGVVRDVRIEQSVRDGVLTATAAVPLDGASALGEGVWRLRTTVTGLARPVTDAPRVPVDGSARLDPRPMRVAGRRHVLAAGRERRLMLLVERTGPVPTAGRAARRVLRLARRLRSAAARRVRRR